MLASTLAMMITDILTMILPIISVIILSVNLGSNYTGINFWDMMTQLESFNFQNVYITVISTILIIVGYLLLLMLIMFCTAMKKSYYYSKPASGLLAFLTGVGVFYIMTLIPLLVSPFAEVSRFYGFITVSVNNVGMAVYTVLMFIFAAVLFLLTSKLFERKINL